MAINLKELHRKRLHYSVICRQTCTFIDSIVITSTEELK